MNTSKIYNSFTDKFGKQYGFDNYADFSKFWFGLSRQILKSYFPNNFNQLQKAAANSTEARTKFKCVTVKFSDPTLNYNTSMNPNVSDIDIRKYFVGKWFDMGRFPVENMQMCISVEIN